ncbi:PepSY domain-containing protein [Streptomyces sp. NPDC002896]|uniref:PepSY domain-containing protein n=1 Tax=Streptomyces sp. NPDC002896 TaxID=3154438 RepID=UPI00331E0C30
MKRTSVILLTAGALAAAITGTALAGSQDVTPTRNTSSVATATPTLVAQSDVTAGPTATTSVSRGRAVEIALAHVGGGQLVEVEPEVEHGRPAWSVKIVKNGSRHKIYVDRSSGQIMRVEQESVSNDRRRDDKSGAIDDRGGSDDGSGNDDRGASDDRRGSDDSGSDDHGRHRGGSDDMGGDTHGRDRD